MHTSKSVAQNFIFNLIKTFTSVIFPIITFTYAARILGEDGIGKFSFVKSLITWFSMFAMLGMTHYGTREAAKLRDDRNKLSKFVHEMLMINGATTTVAYVLLLLAMIIIPKLREYKTLLLINSFAIILQGLGMEWLYQAVEEYRYIAIRSVVFQVIAIVAMFLLVRNAGDVEKYTAIYLFASSGAYVLNFWNARRFIDFHCLGHYEIKKHILPLARLFAMTFSIDMFTVLDSTMLGFLTDDATVGRYTAAIKINKLVISLIVSLSTVLIPRLSYYIGLGAMKKVREIVRKAYNYMFMLSVPAAVGLFVLSDDIIFLFSGSSFISASMTMRAMVPIVFLIPFSVSTNQQTLVPMGKEKRILISTVTGAVVNFVCNLLLIPHYAENGAAYATVISEISVAAVSFYNASKFFDMKDIFKKNYQYWIAVLPIPIIYFMVASLTTRIMVHFFLVIPMSVILYFAILYFLKNEFFLQGFAFVREKLLRKK